MKLLFVWIVLLGVNTYAATSSDCLSGNFSACKQFFDKAASTSEKLGVVELFVKACASQELHVVCQINSVKKEETLKKTLELARPDNTLFVIDGKKLDKIYLMSQSK